jgi:hypothetical protein
MIGISAVQSINVDAAPFVPASRACKNEDLIAMIRLLDGHYGGHATP